MRSVCARSHANPKLDMPLLSHRTRQGSVDLLSIQRIGMTLRIARRSSSRFGELFARQSRLKNRFSRRFSNGEIG